MRPARVAVIGGGCAAMTAAYHLTRPELEGRFAVTVYQQGWRLGGKGASGRGENGRIEEHGLHVWMGFYENAFRLMRAVYRELGRDPEVCPIVDWRDAFVPAPLVGLADTRADGAPAVWSAVFPPLPGQPGDALGADHDNPFTLLGYLVRSAAVMRRLFRVAYGPPEPLAPSPERSSARESRYRDEPVEQLIARAVELSQTFLGAAAVLLRPIEERLEILEALLERVCERLPTTRVVADAAGALLGAIQRLLAPLRALGGDELHRRRAAEVLEVVVAAQLGALREGVLLSPRGFDVLDDLDFAELLRKNGASEAAVDSPFVRGLYSLMFAYERGDSARPRAAAGQALRGCLRMFFTYRGAFFWKMTAGMGDVVFAPLYELLRLRGVSFAFFHRLEEVVLSPEAVHDKHVTALRFAVQAEAPGYQPLIDVKGLPCWPAEPDFAQIVDGATHRGEGRAYESFWDRRRVADRTLSVGKDFDLVVLGVGLGEVPHVCQELLGREPRWREMATHMKTVATQALQLWATPELSSLGWEHGPVTLTSFPGPFDTWADMSHLVAREDWPAAATPGTLGYFCNVLDERVIERCRPDEPAHATRVLAAVDEHTRAFVAEDLPRLWPRATDAHLAARFTTCNVNPTDRYVLCLPGTPQLRISPLDRTYDNLTVAGDWTSCGLNLGCVEAAVMSGMLAAHALSGAPRLEAIVGYDHP